MFAGSIHDPRASVRELLKQLLLIENHCTGGDTRDCRQCVSKHLLAAEALADEAVSLSGGEQEYLDAQAEIYRVVSVWGQPLADVGVVARQARRSIMGRFS